MSLEILKPGPMTTVQAWPGRLGLWAIGVPPSGPMDARSFRLANRVVGNPPEAAALEVTLGDLLVAFDEPATLALVGADMGAALDGVPVAEGEPIFAEAGQQLELGWAGGPGMRAYLAIAGGFAAPTVLGSLATFVLGRFGGHEGRALRSGDQLEAARAPADPPTFLHPQLRPRRTLTSDWTVRVLAGPQGAPDHFTQGDLEMIFSHPWEVEPQSDRTGVRLAGPVPRFGQDDGGDAGLHPSNLHDNAYVVGSLIFTGDSPVLIGPDGPSLGGFASPAVVARGDRWKLGQLRAGDRVRFNPIDRVEAAALDRRERNGAPLEAAPRRAARDESAVRSLKRLESGLIAADGDLLVRRCGDGALLAEFGEPGLDLRLRLRAHALQQRLGEAAIDGVRDVTAGIRSLHVQYEPTEVDEPSLVDRLLGLNDEAESVDALEVPGRVVHLPLAWDDHRAREAVARYMRNVRPDAPWCPDNIEFIRRINGLSDREAVREIVLEASYLVLGLGDVYLGAPVAVPLDPRHRLVTTKYSPARTWTPENAVGIGGAYLCVYGMEGPGGYQLFGRTLQVWNPREIEGGTPWLLRHFDQIRFHPVSTEELDAQRAALLAGELELETEPAPFRLAEQNEFVDEHRESIEAFRQAQQAAFAEERAAWRALAA